MVPRSQAFYWLGLNTTASAWPAFAWLQRYLGWNPNAFGSNSGAGGEYQHWGVVSSGEEDSAVQVVLPDNAKGSEWCGGAAVAHAFDGAWGWDDRGCGVKQSFMCRWVNILSVQRQPAARSTQHTAFSTARDLQSIRLVLPAALPSYPTYPTCPCASPAGWSSPQPSASPRSAAT